MPEEVYAPFRRGSQLKMRFMAAADLQKVMATVRQEKWEYETGTPWSNVERTEAEPSQARPSGRADGLLRWKTRRDPDLHVDFMQVAR